MPLKIFIGIALIGIIASGAFFTLNKRLAPNIPTTSETSSPTPSVAASPVKNTNLVSPKPSPTIKPTISSTLVPIASGQVAIKTDVSGETTVEISEEALSNQIKSSLIGQSLGSTPLGEATITDVKITIHNGYILIDGTAKNGFLTPPFQTKATLELKDQQPKLSLTDLSLNNVSLPQVVANQLTGVIQSKVNDLISSYNFKLKSITLTEGKITLVGEK